MGLSLGHMTQKFVRSSDIRSVRSGRPALRTYDAKFDFAALAYKSRLQGVSTFLSLDSESTQNLGFTGYLVDRSDFHVSIYGSFRTFGAYLRSDTSD